MIKKGVVQDGVTPPINKEQINEKDPVKLEKSFTKDSADKVKDKIKKNK